mmetsp:Transcript_15371/g.23470  ORF Transcript_15371/g.23470 Transcript_15371/m.23470 type:complete len:104 (-) Transcript_15371:168-479(-)|eukprot:CAMPEP_0194767176 /NCGR_PEP_ID=MMETSP0323_2-20130528/34840_1 /TAXON_ID=2866 ORGANISM="Crypthecodinium cohnii, Strain Seligo" /NCGR_SAMPLE_ID=MMETSP0323_2 /ASSEMBLY_ACC=CAM_ASM_000346 /LENGTH=103 /DNA_ID=CAMNT_0039698703 /DNA_START=15 /DNA_END=326 /DNA_ORIENTATION=-
MSGTAVGDLQELRRRKASERPPQEVAASGSMDQGEGISDYEREYIDYFRQKYGDNPRSDFLGIDGMPLFCLIYIVIAGVVLSILYFSVYARHRHVFTPQASLK